MLLRALLATLVLFSAVAAASSLTASGPADCSTVRCAAPQCDARCTTCELTLTPGACCKPKCTACPAGFRPQGDGCRRENPFNKYRQCTDIMCPLAIPSCTEGCDQCVVLDANPRRGQCCASAFCRRCEEGFTLSRTQRGQCERCPQLRCALIPPQCGEGCEDCQGVPNLLSGTTCPGCGWASTKCNKCAEGYHRRGHRCVRNRRGPRVCPALACLVLLPCDTNCESCRTVTPRENGCPGCAKNVCRACKKGYRQTGENTCEPYLAQN